MARRNANKLSARIDLHDLLVDEALRTFFDQYNLCVSRGNKKIEVIHGYGSSGVGGAIKSAFRRYLKTHSKHFAGVTLGDDLANPGVTIVYPVGRLPKRIDPAVLSDTKRLPAVCSRLQGKVDEPIRQTDIEKRVLRVLNTPKTEEKVLAKLRGDFGAPNIRAEIWRLTKAGIIEESALNGQGTCLRIRSKET